MEVDIAVPWRWAWGYTRSDSRSPAGRDGRVASRGARAGRHVPARRVYPERRRGCRRRSSCTSRTRRSGSSASPSATRRLDFGAANEWKAGVVKQMTGGIAGLFKANGVDGSRATASSQGPNTIAVEGGEDVTFKSAVIATGVVPAAPADPRPRVGICASTRPACSPRPRLTSGSSSSAAASSAPSSPRSSIASAPR